MKVNVDREADALYLRLDDSEIVESEEVSPGVVLDYNEANEVIGVESLNLSRRSSDLNLSALEFETVERSVAADPRERCGGITPPQWNQSVPRTLGLLRAPLAPTSSPGAVVRLPQHTSDEGKYS